MLFTALALEDTFYLIEFTKLFSNQIFKETVWWQIGIQKHNVQLLYLFQN